MHEVAHQPHSGPHIEGHFQSSDSVRDVVIGLADGLTVPFALAAGLSGVVASSRLVVLAGLAEIAAGSIAMGLRRLPRRPWRRPNTTPPKNSAKSARSSSAPATRKKRSTTSSSSTQSPRVSAEPVLQALKQNPAAWVDFMMRFELGLEAPAPNRARRSALTIAVSYIAGGLVPLLPYMLVTDATLALRLSVIITLAALALFGALKGQFLGTGWLRSAVQTTLIGGAAAAAAYGLARLLNAYHA